MCFMYVVLFDSYILRVGLSFYQGKNFKGVKFYEENSISMKKIPEFNGSEKYSAYFKRG